LAICGPINPPTAKVHRKIILPIMIAHRRTVDFPAFVGNRFVESLWVNINTGVKVQVVELMKELMKTQYNALSLFTLSWVACEDDIWSSL
jgi:hypothetical protein